ncbi:MAG TPA: DUF4190 domain-containing protein [Dissulfurispiraceae bacterium]|nr:DUF4190 domain-containing protein [Dissulfurispiraceae bacterium]
MNQTAPEYEPQYKDVPVKTSSEAIVSLISAILGWLGFFGLGGIVAVIFGHIAKGKIRKSEGRIGGDGLATAGLVLGYANIAITFMGICLILLVIFGVISAGAYLIPFTGTWVD